MTPLSARYLDAVEFDESWAKDRARQRSPDGEEYIEELFVDGQAHEANRRANLDRAVAQLVEACELVNIIEEAKGLGFSLPWAKTREALSRLDEALRSLEGK